MRYFLLCLIAILSSCSKKNYKNYEFEWYKDGYYILYNDEVVDSIITVSSYMSLIDKYFDYIDSAFNIDSLEDISYYCNTISTIAYDSNFQNEIQEHEVCDQINNFFSKIDLKYSDLEDSLIYKWIIENLQEITRISSSKPIVAVESNLWKEINDYLMRFCDSSDSFFILFKSKYFLYSCQCFLQIQKMHIASRIDNKYERVFIEGYYDKKYIALTRYSRIYIIKLKKGKGDRLIVERILLNPEFLTVLSNKTPEFEY